MCARSAWPVERQRLSKDVSHRAFRPGVAMLARAPPSPTGSHPEQKSAAIHGIPQAVDVFSISLERWRCKMRSVAHDGGAPCRTGIVIVAIALLLAACHDASRSAVPSAPEIARDVVSSRINPDSTFNFFAVDVSMSMTGLDSLYQPDLVRSVSYHVERTLDDGVWTTSTSLLTVEPLGAPTAGSNSTADVARIVSTSDGLIGQLYDSQSVLIAPPQQVNFDTLVVGHEQFHAAMLAGMPNWPQGFGISAMRTAPDGSATIARNVAASAPVVRHDEVPDNADPRAWIRRYAVAPWQRQSAVAASRRHFGDPAGKVGSLQRYTTRFGGSLFETLVDSASGAIVEENIAEGGQLRLHTIHRFTQLSNGVLVHLSDRSEMAGAHGSAPRAVIETTFSNMRIETHGGAR